MLQNGAQRVGPKSTSLIGRTCQAITILDALGMCTGGKRLTTAVATRTSAGSVSSVCRRSASLPRMEILVKSPGLQRLGSDQTLRLKS